VGHVLNRMTLPIALFRDSTCAGFRPGRVLSASTAGVVRPLPRNRQRRLGSSFEWAARHHLSRTPWLIALVGYGFAPMLLPVWMLIAPSEYLTTFMRSVTIVLLACAVVAVHYSARRRSTDFCPHRPWAVFAGGFSLPILYYAARDLRVPAFCSRPERLEMIQQESEVRLSDMRDAGRVLRGAVMATTCRINNTIQAATTR